MNPIAQTGQQMEQNKTNPTPTNSATTPAPDMTPMTTVNRSTAMDTTTTMTIGPDVCYNITGQWSGYLVCGGVPAVVLLIPLVMVIMCICVCKRKRKGEFRVLN